LNIQIITSSYPAFIGDPSGTAGLFVQSFAQELAMQGHRVIVQPIARKKTYQVQTGIIIEPITWKGGDRELASMNFLNPRNWFLFFMLFRNGKRDTLAVVQRYAIDRVLCMWIIPCGIFGYWIKKKFNKQYDVWALGSDIWKIRKIPLFGNLWINLIVRGAKMVYADGFQLCADVKTITGRECHFLASARALPVPDGSTIPFKPADAAHLIFVGRYHKNKGPDLLLEAVTYLSPETKNRIRIHLFGLGDMEEELKEYCLAKNLADTVNINGPINARDLANRLKQAEFLLIPSRIESIPVIFSDALQSGTPVIAMPVGDLPRFINEFGCGILANDISAQAFANAIEMAVQQKKAGFASSVQSAYQKFKISHSVDQWLSEKGA
jgi:glycosyltransferase involved in cell wall biosynthesis